MPTALDKANSARLRLQLCGLLVLLSLFCGLAAAQKSNPESAGLSSELAKAPAAARDWKNPYEGQLDAVRAGKKLYERHCADCHGASGQGGEQGPDLRSVGIPGVPPGIVFWFLKNGDLKDGMPSWSRLPDQRLWQLVSYLQTLPAEESGKNETENPHP